MVVDCHIHARDFNQRDKDTVEHVLQVAYDTGVDAVFDMPNTDPPLMTRDLVIDRLKLAQDANIPDVFYGTYMGLTADFEQVRRAVATYREFFPQVVGFKLYAGHSTGNLGVVKEEDQLRVYQTLAEEGFDGVLAVHCEKESLMNAKAFDKNDPISHSYARPPIAEVESVRDQTNFALDAGFKGKLHIAHISVPQAVILVSDARRRGVDVSCGVCPHHIVYNNRIMLETDGLLQKMNPPLRPPFYGENMLAFLASGEINWVETDHAPHTLDQKMNECASGLPGLHKLSLFLEFLRLRGLSEHVIQNRSHDAIVDRFGIEISSGNVFRKDHTEDYGFNPWKKFEDRVAELRKHF